MPLYVSLIDDIFRFVFANLLKMLLFFAHFLVSFHLYFICQECCYFSHFVPCKMWMSECAVVSVYVHVVEYVTLAELHFLRISYYFYLFSQFDLIWSVGCNSMDCCFISSLVFFIVCYSFSFRFFLLIFSLSICCCLSLGVVAALPMPMIRPILSTWMFSVEIEHVKDASTAHCSILSAYILYKRRFIQRRKMNLRDKIPSTRTAEEKRSKRKKEKIGKRWKLITIMFDCEIYSLFPCICSVWLVDFPFPIPRYKLRIEQNNESQWAISS